MTEYDEAMVQLLSRVRLGDTMTAACQASVSITNSQSLLKLTSSSCWCHPTVSSSVVPFFCLQSFPASGSFQMSQFFASGGQSTGVSASVLPMNIKDWFNLGWTGWISLWSKGLSESFPTPQFKIINSSLLSFLYSPTLTSIHDYWKNQALTRRTFIGKIMPLLFNMLSMLVIAFLPKSVF